jgi:peptidoglycan-N-acetylmuramic acid deacetylase
MRKSRILSLFLLLLLVLPASAEGMGWYFHHSRDGEQMPPPPELAYVEKYDGYYADRRHASMEDGEKVLYLTFDAGYENGNVGKVLDILKEENVPGAFFILEGLVRQEPGLVQRMAEEGHLVCNHTATHRDMTKVTTLDAFREELTRMEEAYRGLTGQDIARFYRPPEGKISEQNMAFAKELGYTTVFWSFAYADWDNRKQMNPDKAKQKILSNIHPGEVMLLHPTSETNAQVLGEVIDECRRMGYRFGTLDELTARA